MTAIGFPRVQIVFYKQKDTFKKLNLLLTFVGILDTGIIYLIQIHPAPIQILSQYK
jgi:hypothetical protein